MRMRRASSFVLSVLVAGCAQRVVWFGHSDDRRHVVSVIESAGKQRVRLDGREGPALLGVGVEGLALSSDGRHLAYPARRPGGWAVIHDGHEDALWDGVGAVALSPDGAHVAYAAERARRWHVVRDAEVGPPADAILEGSLSFGTGGQLLYAIERAGEAHAVVDGVEGPGWEALGGLSTSADGAHTAYVARRGSLMFAMVDGAASGPYEAIAELALAPRRGGVAVVARTEGKWRVIVDGAEGAAFDRISRVRWSPAGGRVAYAAKRGSREVVVVDGTVVGGEEASPFDAVMPASLAFDGSGAHVAFAARRDGRWRVTADGREGAPFDEVDAPTWSDDGVLGYVARRGFVARAVIDGKEGVGWAWASDLVLGSGGRFAYLAGHGAHSYVVDDRGEREYALVVSGTLSFSREGTRWGCIAGDARSRKLFIAAEGGGQRPLDAEELVAAISKPSADLRPSQRLDAEILRRWVAAELDLPDP
jgi:hypothetical protein